MGDADEVEAAAEAISDRRRVLVGVAAIASSSNSAIDSSKWFVL